MADIPANIAQYLAARDAERTNRVIKALKDLSDRERNLIREAAVMGYVQGRQSGRGSIPGDNEILRNVILGCQDMDDLYPTISSLGRPDRG